MSIDLSAVRNVGPALSLVNEKSGKTFAAWRSFVVVLGRADQGPKDLMSAGCRV